MRIGATRNVNLDRDRRPPVAPARDQAGSGRALVALAQPSPRATLHAAPKLAGPAVTAQLFAQRDGAPQFRERRRASGPEAEAAYASVRLALRRRTGPVADLLA